MWNNSWTDTVARSAKLYWCISVKTSNVGLFDISPPSRNRPKARKYVGAAPLDLAAAHTCWSETTHTLMFWRHIPQSTYEKTGFSLIQPSYSRCDSWCLQDSFGIEVTDCCQSLSVAHVASFIAFGGRLHTLQVSAKTHLFDWSYST